MLLLLLVQVELIGRMQRQPAPADNRFYTCIDYVKLVGTPLYGFEPCNGHLALTQRVSTTAGGSEGLRGAGRVHPHSMLLLHCCTQTKGWHAARTAMPNKACNYGYNL